MKNYLLLIIIHFITTFFLNSKTNSQEIQNLSMASYGEKIYLQLDKTIYTDNETIWFKAIVTDAIQHKPTPLSKILYVELISPGGIIIETKTVKLYEGIGDGFFQLYDGLEVGNFLIRAYTLWNNNFGEDFIFKKYIKIYPLSEQKKKSVISNIRIVEKDSNNFYLEASLFPTLLDSTIKRKVDVYLDIDGTKDTITLKGNSNGKYQLEYGIKKIDKIATLSMKTRGGNAISKTIALDEDYLDLQFFPESGDLLNGIKTKVGFKAMGFNGKGVLISGDVVNQKGEIVTTFNSNQFGMGYFVLHPKSNHTYYARIESKGNNGKKIVYPLPKIVLMGNHLSVSDLSDHIRLMVNSNYLKRDSVSIIVKSRGKSYFLIEGNLVNGRMVTSISKNALPEGIIVFTLLDNNNVAVAERLYFNERIDSRIKIELNFDKENYRQREKTKLKIKTLDKYQNPLATNFSLLVINQALLGNKQINRQNILSCFLLDSELRGEIENPGYYFNKQNLNRKKDLDILLITQGWRRYIYDKPKEPFEFPPEQSLLVKGTVSSILAENSLKEGIELTMIAYSDPVTIQKQETDSLGRFYFNVDDKYGQDINILIQSKDEKGKKREYNIELDRKVIPTIRFDQKRMIVNVDSVIYGIIENSKKRKQIEDAFRIKDDFTFLDEVTIEDYKMTPEREKVMKRYGRPTIVIDGQAISNREKKWSSGLYHVLMLNFRNELQFDLVTGPNNSYWYASLTDSHLTTLVIIDGIPVIRSNYPLIQNIPASEVKSVEIIENAKNFNNLYLQAIPDAKPYQAPIFGNVISIFTYAGKGLDGVERTPGMLKTSIPVFSPRKEFYSPEYTNKSQIDWSKPDFRALVHWDPIIETNDNGVAKTSFFNADLTGNMMVIIEAISSDGKIGFLHYSYPVRNREKN